MRAAEQSVQTELDAAKTSVDAAMNTDANTGASPDARPADPAAHDADGLPIANSSGAAGRAAALNGAAHPAEPAAEPQVERGTETASEAGRAPEKSGA